MLSKSNNFLASINETNDGLGFSIMDISTGEFSTAQFKDREALESELARFSPAEVIIPANNENISNWMLAMGIHTTPRESESWAYPVAKKILEERFGSVSELNTYPMAVTSAGAILSYVKIHNLVITTSQTSILIGESKNHDFGCCHTKKFRNCEDNWRFFQRYIICSS